MNKTILLFGASSLGLINFRLNFMKDLKGLGYSVVACAPLDSHSESVKVELGSLGIDFLSLKLKKSSISVFSDLGVIVALYKIIVAQNPDMVFLYNIKPVIYGSLVSKAAGVKKIYSMITGVGTVFISEKIATKLLCSLVKALYKISLKFNTKVFFQNPDDLNLFVDEQIVPKEKVVLVNGSGVDVNHYAPAPLSQTAKFLMVARLIKDKGIYEYVSACKILKSRYPHAVFCLVGDLDSNPTSLSAKELKTLVDEKIVDYSGGVRDIRPVLSVASVFVLPSYREGTSKAVLEAMAMGRPIITTDAPGCRETIVEGVNGYLVPIKNIVALVETMEKFILQPEIIAKMGKESRRIAEEKYDVNKVNKSILNVINAV
ncbi:MAG: hypothetical protein ACD_21C00250G0017 [uncultured bacterium]|nr:MAG: hypothetical protein ACD_21C00250G0017 [uncultured bacterium]